MEPERLLTRRKSIENVIERGELKSIIIEMAMSTDKTKHNDAGKYFARRSAIAKLVSLDLRPSIPAAFIRDYIVFLVK